MVILPKQHCGGPVKQKLIFDKFVVLLSQRQIFLIPLMRHFRILIY